MPAADYLELDVTGMTATAVTDLIDERLNHPRRIYKHIDFVQQADSTGPTRLLMRTWKTELDFSEFVGRRERRVH
jgi:hypothetical protein